MTENSALAAERGNLAVDVAVQFGPTIVKERFEHCADLLADFLEELGRVENEYLRIARTAKNVTDGVNPIDVNGPSAVPWDVIDGFPGSALGKGLSQGRGALP
jgi:hypothetical protein